MAMTNGLTFPGIDPIIVSIPLFGTEFSLRWYALAYIVGISIGWLLVRRAMARPGLWRNDTPPMDKDQIEDLLTAIIIGVVVGGRLGYVLFYSLDYYLANPLQIFVLWTGGLSFHGGFLGVVAAVLWVSRKHALPLGDIANIIALAATPAIFLVRIANFINAELYGRVTDVAWAVTFPQMCFDPAQQGCPEPGAWFYTGTELPRHPSQLYEAGLEGLLLGLILLYLAFGRGWLKRPWSMAGVFFLGYGLARFAVEFVRQPDEQFVSPGNPLGLAFHIDGVGLTMGQTLSLPMILVGLAVVLWSRRRAT